MREIGAASLDVGGWEGLTLHEDLVGAWRELHHAAQGASEAGKGWGAVEADDSHSSLVVDGRRLVGARVAGGTPFRAALVMDRLRLEMLEGSGRASSSLELEGRTMDEAMGWVRETAASLSGDTARQDAVPAPDLPDHTVARGAPFGSPGGAHEAIAGLYAWADRLIRSVRDAAGGDTDVRVWPHHFDIAGLFEVARSAEGQATRTIGVGMGVPDALAGTGYLYVRAWSKDGGADPSRHAPSLRWEGDLGVLALRDIERNAGAAGEFVASAFNASLRSLSG